MKKIFTLLLVVIAVAMQSCSHVVSVPDAEVENNKVRTKVNFVNKEDENLIDLGRYNPMMDYFLLLPTNLYLIPPDGKTSYWVEYVKNGVYHRIDQDTRENESFGKSDYPGYPAYHYVKIRAAYNEDIKIALRYGNVDCKCGIPPLRALICPGLYAVEYNVTDSVKDNELILVFHLHQGQVDPIPNLNMIRPMNATIKTSKNLGNNKYEYNLTDVSYPEIVGIKKVSARFPDGTAPEQNSFITDPIIHTITPGRAGWLYVDIVDKFGKIKTVKKTVPD